MSGNFEQNRSTAPRVRVLPLQPHCFAFGGFELQMLNALAAAREAGAEVSALDPWSRDAQFDVLHIWGLHIQQLNTAEWAYRAHKRLVVSTLFPYLNWKTRIRQLGSRLSCPGRLRRTMLPWINVLSVVNQQQGYFATQILSVPSERVSVSPNIVDDVYFAAAQPDWKHASGSIFERDYVICVGNICQRKNQLRLVNACQQLDLSLLLVGDVLTGEEQYADSLSARIKDSALVRWIPGLPPGSFELANAYRNASAFALLSLEERQPVSALEAAAVGKSLLLADRPYARQSFFEGAQVADPVSINAIARALRSVVTDPRRYMPAPEIISSCNRLNVGRRYAAAYEQALIK